MCIRRMEVCSSYKRYVFLCFVFDYRLMYLLADYEADAPRRAAAQEWLDWVAHTSKFIPATYKHLPGEPLSIATQPFTPESGLIRNSKYTYMLLMTYSHLCDCRLLRKPSQEADCRTPRT